MLRVPWQSFNSSFTRGVLINAQMYGQESRTVDSLQSDRVSENSSCSRFSTDAGCGEHFVLIRSRAGIRFTDATDELSREYAAALEKERLSDSTVVFSRLFVSDWANQKDALNDSWLLDRLRQGALSIVEQKPVGGGQFSLFSYHLRRRAGATFVKQISNKFSDCQNTVIASLENYRLLFTATMDSPSIGGLTKGQIVRMEAPTHLSPAILYNVTFERGLRVRFGDRSHLYISGTASINSKGEVLHAGDVEKQTRRTIANLRALLAEHSASPSDMAYLLVYCRSFHEWERIRRVLREEIGETVPVISVQAKVCRP